MDDLPLSKPGDSSVSILNLLLLGDFYDIALRDFGLLLGALTVSRLAAAFPGVGFSSLVGR